MIIFSMIMITVMITYGMAYADVPKWQMKFGIDQHPPEGMVVVRINDNSSSNRITHCTPDAVCAYPLHSIHTMLNHFANYTEHTIVRVTLEPSNIVVFNATIKELP